MFCVSSIDVQYALEELKSPGYRLNNMAWESDLNRHSSSFWEFFQKQMESAARAKSGDISSDTPIQQEALLELCRMRRILTIVFATVYSACGQSLPVLLKTDALDVSADFHKNGFNPDRIIDTMAALNKNWAGVFRGFLEDWESHPFSLYIICVASQTLLDHIDIPIEFKNRTTVSMPAIVREPEKNRVVEKPPQVVKETLCAFDQVGGQDAAKAEVMKLSSALNNPERYKRWGTKPPRGICLYGPPGNGKTLLAKALAKETNKPFYDVKASQLSSMWYGQSEKNIDELFNKARQTGGIIFFDEADSLAPSRANPQAHEVTRRVVAALNRNMDGFEPLDRVVVFFATNQVESIDEAVLRPGRIDRLIEVPQPDKEGRRQIFQIHINNAEAEAGRALFEALDMDLLLEESGAMSGADIAEAVRRMLEVKVVQEEKTGQEAGLVTTEELLARVKEEKRERSLNTRGPWTPFRGTKAL